MKRLLIDLLTIISKKTDFANYNPERIRAFHPRIISSIINILLFLTFSIKTFSDSVKLKYHQLMATHVKHELFIQKFEWNFWLRDLSLLLQPSARVTSVKVEHCP